MTNASKEAAREIVNKQEFRGYAASLELRQQMAGIIDAKFERLVKAAQEVAAGFLGDENCGCEFCELRAALKEINER